MKILVANDIHLFSTIALCEPEDLVHNIDTFDGPVILAGDIVDMGYCAYKDLPHASQFSILLQNKIKAKNAVDGISEWLEGNHSLFGLVKLMGLRQFKYIDKDKKYLIHHGHIWGWTPEHVQTFMSKTPGAGWFMRSVLVTLVNDLRRMLGTKPNDLYLAALEKEKALNPNLIKVWSGHNHPKNDVPFTYAGVDGTVFSRGLHVIDVPV